MNREMLLDNKHIVSNGINRCAVHGVCRDGFHSQALLSVSGCHVFGARTRVAFQRVCLQKPQVHVVVRDRVQVYASACECIIPEYRLLDPGGTSHNIHPKM